jgi:hypothetical protein
MEENKRPVTTLDWEVLLIMDAQKKPSEHQIGVRDHWADRRERQVALWGDPTPVTIGVRISRWRET